MPLGMSARTPNRIRMGILAFPVAGLLSIISISNPSAFLFAGMSALLSVTGSILFGTAIWQSHQVPRLSGILYFIAILFSFLSAPFYSFTLGFLGGVLLLISGGWIATSVVRRRIAYRLAANPRTD